VNRYASIDIGSNTILLLIGEITPQNTLQVVLESEETTRLGRGLQAGGRLDRHSVQKSIAVLKNYVSLCRQKAAKEVVAVGTNALRLAGDAAEFLQLVKRECHLLPQIIDAQQEAYFSYLAVEKDPMMPPDAFVIDVGGGSTEYTFPCIPFQAISLPLGAVRLTEEFLHGDPPAPDEVSRVQMQTEKHLDSLPAAIEEELVGIGGTAVTLGSIHLGHKEPNHNKIHGMKLSRREIRALTNRLLSVNLSARKNINGLPPARADIMPAGAMIILASMERFKKKQIHISCRGLRYGLFYERFMS